MPNAKQQSLYSICKGTLSLGVVAQLANVIMSKLEKRHQIKSNNISIIF